MSWQTVFIVIAAFMFGLLAFLIRHVGNFEWMLPAGLSLFTIAHLP